MYQSLFSLALHLLIKHICINVICSSLLVLWTHQVHSMTCFYVYLSLRPSTVRMCWTSNSSPRWKGWAGAQRRLFYCKVSTGCVPIPWQNEVRSLPKITSVNVLPWTLIDDLWPACNKMEINIDFDNVCKQTSVNASMWYFSWHAWILPLWN